MKDFYKHGACYIFIVFIAALAGCAQIPPYQDAKGDKTAKIRLKMADPIISNLFLVSVDVGRCTEKEGFLWVSGGVDRLYSKKVGMLDSTPPSEGILEYVIPANKPMAARTVMHVAKLNAAEILLSTGWLLQEHIRNKQPGVCPAPALLPRAGEEYEIVYSVQPGNCKTTIYQLKKSAENVERIDITKDYGVSVTGEKDNLTCQKL